MKRLSVDTIECKRCGAPADDDRHDDKERQIRRLVRHIDHAGGNQENSKLPRRDRAQDAIFILDKLWNRYLIHTTRLTKIVTLDMLLLVLQNASSTKEAVFITTFCDTR